MDDNDYMYWLNAGNFEEEEEEVEGGYYSNNNNNNNSIKMEVELGSMYQINHSKLTPRTPVPLRSIRLVMVSEKTEWNVSVRYPSIESLKRYFNNKYNEIYPEMDQKFVMDRKLAERVLFRRVPSEEFLVKKDMEEFWLVMSSSGGSEQSSDVVSRKNSLCLSELKSSGVPGWGVRRQVKFIGRHRELNTSPSSSSIVKDIVEDVEVGAELEQEEETMAEIEGEEGGEKEEEEEEELVVETSYNRPKRKCCEVNLKGNKKAKKVKIEKKKKENKKKCTKKICMEIVKGKCEKKKEVKNNCKEIVLAKTPMSKRWSDDRYKQAQKHLLEVMKEKGATCEKPILRPELRADARKKIGDTGLLDHLLKHVAGMVAPGGTERFRRRHNAGGAMEYWLESASLVDLRREVGVEDPFWIPPPGWKVGDSPTQDPICAQEIKELREETSKLKRSLKDTKKQTEKELAKLRREMEKLISKNQKKEAQAIVVSNPSKKELVATKTLSTNDNTYAKMEKYYKEHFTILSDQYTRIEEELVNLKSKVEDKYNSEQALIALTEAFPEKRNTEPHTIGKTELVHPQMEKDTLKADKEEKAAKIERLKSGFRLCKPQGTFLWPNSNGTSNVVVQVEDTALVPTPPSVSSATVFAPPQLPPLSPVRPRPEKRAITVTVSSIGNNNFSSTTTTTTTNGSSNKTTTWINLNDVPGSNLKGGVCSSRQQQSVLTTTDVVPSVSDISEPMPSSSGSSSKKEVATWLALAAPTDSVDDPTFG